MAMALRICERYYAGEEPVPFAKTQTARLLIEEKETS